MFVSSCHLLILFILRWYWAHSKLTHTKRYVRINKQGELSVAIRFSGWTRCTKSITEKYCLFGIEVIGNRIWRDILIKDTIFIRVADPGIKVTLRDFASPKTSLSLDIKLSERYLISSRTLLFITLLVIPYRLYSLSLQQTKRKSLVHTLLWWFDQHRDRHHEAERSTRRTHLRTRRFRPCWR